MPCQGGKSRKGKKGKGGRKGKLVCGEPPEWWSSQMDKMREEGGHP